MCKPLLNYTNIKITNKMKKFIVVAILIGVSVVAMSQDLSKVKPPKSPKPSTTQSNPQKTTTIPGQTTSAQQQQTQNQEVRLAPQNESEPTPAPKTEIRVNEDGTASIYNSESVPMSESKTEVRIKSDGSVSTYKSGGNVRAKKRR